MESKHSIARKRRRARRKANKQCPDCGTPVERFVRCYGCRTEYARWFREWQQRQRAMRGELR